MNLKITVKEEYIFWMYSSFIFAKKYIRVISVEKEKIDKKKSGFSYLKKMMKENKTPIGGEPEYFEKKLKKNKQPDNADSADKKVSKSLDENLGYIQSLLGDDPTITVRTFDSSSENPIMCAAVFLDGLSDDTMISEQFIKPIIRSGAEKTEDVMNTVMTRVLYGSDCKTSDDMSEIISSLLSGDSVYFVDGAKSGIIADTKGFKTRSVEEPQNETAVKGPREGFVENIITNISLVRRKLKTVDFKMRFFTFGKESNTKIAVCYLDTVVNKNALKLLYSRLERIDIDAVLDGNYLEEFITDGHLTAFRTVGSTERPDTVAAKLLEGRIAVIVDGSPMVFTVPYIMIEGFQTSDDYYSNSFYASFMRILRIFSFFAAIMIPGLFVALIAFHNYMLPTELTLSFISARQGVPFPAVAECIILLLAFEIIRETAQRVPDSIGQPLSIVGALVLGDAAISARYASAPMLIVVALSCLAGLMIQNMKNPILFFRIFFLVLSAVLGLYGFLLAFLVFFVHLLSLESFGVEYFDYNIFKSPQAQKDYLMRAPWWFMLTFPEDMTKAEFRQKGGGS